MISPLDLRRELRRGAQAAVRPGFDAGRARDVAVKLMRAAAALARRGANARRAAALAHCLALRRRPLQKTGTSFAWIYADKAAPGGIEPGEKELSLLRTLRNRAVLAFKQAA